MRRDLPSIERSAAKHPAEGEPDGRECEDRHENDFLFTELGACHGSFTFYLTCFPRGASGNGFSTPKRLLNRQEQPTDAHESTRSDRFHQSNKADFARDGQPLTRILPLEKGIWAGGGSAFLFT